MLSRTKRTPRLALAAALAAVSAAAAAAPPAKMARLSGLNLPLSFEKNTGHWPKGVEFVARGGGGTLFLTRREAVLSLRKGDKAAALRLKLQGSNGAAVASGLEKQPGIVNYFIGNDPAQWRTKVPTYSRVKLAGVYRGIDLVYYGAGKSRTLEYDFVVKPGADAKQIRMAVSGAKSLRTAGGRLIASTACGDVTLNRPYAYQTIDGVRKQVACAFTLERNTVAFQVARYDASRPLIVDPTLEYSTLIGGAANDDGGYDIAVDGTVAAYVAGSTFSADFPTTSGAYSVSHQGATDAFVAKLNATGTGLIYSTFIGGEVWDDGRSVAVDSAGCAYVMGSTNSSAFPTTTGAYQTALSGAYDVFVAKLNAAGTALTYSTLLGSGNADNGCGMAVDAAGAAYITGTTDSPGFPTTPGAFDSSLTVANDAFVTKLNASGTGLVYSTFLGGGDDDQGLGIATDDTGNAYITGYTCSADFPTTSGAYDTTYNGMKDAFAVKLNPTGTNLIYATYVGGSSDDEQGQCVAVDSAGAAYIAGYTWSADYPTTSGAYDTSHNGNVDVFVTKISSDGKALTYSTLLGGNDWDEATRIVVDGDGCASVAGTTLSVGFPTTADALATSFGGVADAFVAQMNATGTGLKYSTFLGGTGNDNGRSVALGPGQSMFVTGYTRSAAFPTTAGAYQTSRRGSNDAFVLKMLLSSTKLTVDSLAGGAGARVTLRARLTDAGEAGIAGQRLQFRIDSGAWVNSEILTTPVGYAVLTITAPAAGAHTLDARFEASGAYGAATASGTLTTTALPATSLEVTSITAGPGDAFTMVAYLRGQGTGTSPGPGLLNKPVGLRMNGGAWLGAYDPTDANGRAYLKMTAPSTPGTYSLEAMFIGDAGYAACAGSGTLTVAAKRSCYVYTINRTGKVGTAGSLVAYFYWYKKDGTMTPVSGKSLRFQCAGAGLDSSATTDASGKATVLVTPATAGSHPFTVTFTADTDYNAGSGGGTLTVAP